MEKLAEDVAQIQQKVAEIDAATEVRACVR